MLKTVTVIGVPTVSIDPNMLITWPVEGREQVQRIRSEKPTNPMIHNALREEYWAIVEGIRAMGVDLRVLRLPWHDLDQLLMLKLELAGVKCVDVPEMGSAASMIYPRDLATALPNGITLIRPDTRRLLEGEIPPEVPTMVSPFAEGGAILLRRRVAVVSELIIDNDYYRIQPAKPHLKPLTSAGIKVGRITNNVHYVIEPRADAAGYCYDGHIDRWANLLEDPSGGLHLIVDPLARLGLDSTMREPRCSSKKTFEHYRELCASLSIELHIPKEPCVVPMSYGFYQAPDGKVLMTSGDEPMYVLVRKIMGEKRVYRTSVPIRYNPVFCLAGLRCLVTDLPEWMIGIR